MNNVDYLFLLTPIDRLALGTAPKDAYLQGTFTDESKGLTIDAFWLTGDVPRSSRMLIKIADEYFIPEDVLAKQREEEQPKPPRRRRRR